MFHPMEPTFRGYLTYMTYYLACMADRMQDDNRNMQDDNCSMQDDDRSMQDDMP